MPNNKASLISITIDNSFTIIKTKFNCPNPYDKLRYIFSFGQAMFSNLNENQSHMIDAVQKLAVLHKIGQL